MTIPNHYVWLYRTKKIFYMVKWVEISVWKKYLKDFIEWYRPCLQDQCIFLLQMTKNLNFCLGPFKSFILWLPSLSLAADFESYYNNGIGYGTYPFQAWPIVLWWCTLMIVLSGWPCSFPARWSSHCTLTMNRTAICRWKAVSSLDHCPSPSWLLLSAINYQYDHLYHLDHLHLINTL